MLWWLAQNTLTAALLAVVVALLCRLGRFRPAVRHALWLIVLAKLLTPPVVAWPWELPGWGWFVPAEPSPTAEALPPNEPGPAPDLEPEAFPAPEQLPPDELAVLVSEADPGAGEELPTASQGKAPLGRPPWLASLILYVWISGTAGMSLLQLVRVSRFRRLLAGARVAPAWLARPVTELARKLRVRRPATLVVPGIASPFVWGLGRPKLLWPAALTDGLPAHCRRSVLTHELAHLRRRDHWVGWLELLAGCVWWWNPLFWYVRRQLRLNAELACDAWVIGTWPEDRRAYAEALIEVSQLVSRTAAPAPAWGISGGARQAFERRLVMIMGERVPCKVPLLGLVAIGVLGLAALPGWSQVQVQVRKAEEVKKQETQTGKVLLDLLQQPAVQEQVFSIQLDDLIVAQEVKKGSEADHDKRLQALELQLQALLKEVRTLRTGDGKAAIRHTRIITPPVLAEGRSRVVVQPEQMLARVVRVHPPVQVQVLSEVRVERLSRTDGAAVINLSRATYQLPHDKAESLAGILRELVKAKVLETKVEGDSLTVTTTPEALKAIGGLVGLIQGKTTAAADFLRKVPVQGDHVLPEQQLQLYRTRQALSQVILEQEKQVKKREVDRKLQELKDLELKIEQLKKEVGQPRKD